MEPQVKKEHYLRKKYDDLNRFISYFYQIDLASRPDVKSILEIGKGNGTVSDYLKKLGYNLISVDIDPNLKPDIVADVRQLPMKDVEFDLVMACEVLEHLPFEDFEKTLEELKRVSKRYVLVSLPYRSTGFEVVFKFPFIRTILRMPILSLFFRIPLKFGGIKISGQHYWEIDFWKYSLRKIRKIIKRHFKIIKEVRPVLNHYHQFFILSSK